MSHVKFLLLHILSFISGSVLLPHPEKNPLASWGCALLLCKQRHSTHLSYHGIVVPGKSPVKLPAHSHALTLWLNQHVAFGCSSLASPYIIDIALTCFFLFSPPIRSIMKRTFSSTLPTVMRVCMGTAKGKSDPTSTTTHLSETSTSIHSFKY